MADRIGQRFGKYRLTRLLGEGGYGEVYLGEHVTTKALAAIKLLLTKADKTSFSDKASFEEFIEEQNKFKNKFIKEASTAVQMRHPHIVQLLDFGADDDTLYLIMTYAPNGTLRTRHKAGIRLELDSIVSYVKQIAEALQYMHDNERIHRDIKPENILIGENDELLLADFGIAVELHSTDSMRTQDMNGTMAYTAPEQLKKKPHSASDQYSLAIMVYEWLCEERPFTGDQAQMMYQQIYVDPPPFSTHNVKIAQGVEAVVMQALDKDYKKRFPSVQDFAKALEEAYIESKRAKTPEALHELMQLRSQKDLDILQDETFVSNLLECVRKNPDWWKKQARADVANLFNIAFVDRSSPRQTANNLKVVLERIAQAANAELTQSIQKQEWQIFGLFFEVLATASSNAKKLDLFAQHLLSEKMTPNVAKLLLLVAGLSDADVTTLMNAHGEQVIKRYTSTPILIDLFKRYFDTATFVQSGKLLKTLLNYSPAENDIFRWKPIHEYVQNWDVVGTFFQAVNIEFESLYQLRMALHAIFQYKNKVDKQEQREYVRNGLLVGFTSKIKTEDELGRVIDVLGPELITEKEKSLGWPSDLVFLLHLAYHAASRYNRTRENDSEAYQILIPYIKVCLWRVQNIPDLVLRASIVERCMRNLKVTSADVSTLKSLNRAAGGWRKELRDAWKAYVKDADDSIEFVKEVPKGQKKDILISPNVRKKKLAQGQFVKNVLSPVKTTSQKPLVAIGLILVALAIIMAGFAATMSIKNATLTSPTSITPTTGPNRTQTAIVATQTATAAQITPTIDTSAPGGQLYANTIKKSPTIMGFQSSEQWDTTKDVNNNPLCYFDKAPSKNYHAVSEVANTYTPCLAMNTHFKNFVYQVSMAVNNNGYAGGVIFRDDGQGHYYRFALEKSFDQSYGFTIFYCYPSAISLCADQQGEGVQFGSGVVPDAFIIPNQPITLAVIAQNNDVYFYVNRHFLTFVTPDVSKVGTTTQAGWIGVLAGSSLVSQNGNIAPTDVVFSDLKVWDLGNS